MVQDLCVFFQELNRLLCAVVLVRINTPFLLQDSTAIFSIQMNENHRDQEPFSWSENPNYAGCTTEKTRDKRAWDARREITERATIHWFIRFSMGGLTKNRAFVWGQLDKPGMHACMRVCVCALSWISGEEAKALKCSSLGGVFVNPKEYRYSVIRGFVKTIS